MVCVYILIANAEKHYVQEFLFQNMLFSKLNLIHFVIL